MNEAGDILGIIFTVMGIILFFAFCVLVLDTMTDYRL